MNRFQSIDRWFIADFLADAACIILSVISRAPWAMTALLCAAALLLVPAYLATAAKEKKTMLLLRKHANEDIRERREWDSLLFHEEYGRIVDWYIDQVKEKDAAEEYERQATLQALQSQINPHFIYNTLECIRGQALLDKNQGVADMLEALGNYFRYSISRREDLVTLADEIENIQRYMLIQNYRFQNRYQLDIVYMDDDDVLGCYLPKLTLQPIVENALLHGMEDKRSGCITVQIDTSDDMLLLVVSDDGSGMDPETLQALTRRITSHGGPVGRPATGNGIALQNVNRRIRMLFGQEYGLHVYSTPGKGTDVEIAIPRITRLVK